jgi:hypothetical protein
VSLFFCVKIQARVIKVGGSMRYLVLGLIAGVLFQFLGYSLTAYTWQISGSVSGSFDFMRAILSTGMIAVVIWLLGTGMDMLWKKTK